MAQLSQPTQKLISRYQQWHQSLQPRGGVSTIHVDEVASKVAAFYEKIRTIVDWKEEHLMRRSAIMRKLKRRFVNLEFNDLSIAEPLVLELIRGGHFPNDRIEESKITEVKDTIDKYGFIFKNSPPAKSGREKLQFYNWLLEIAACEIEEILSPPRKENALINYMFDLMKERITLNEGIIASEQIGEQEKNIQIYIAVQQALFKLDRPIISYNLIKYQYPQWNVAKSEEFSKISKNIYEIWETVENHLNHPLGKKFYVVCEKYDTPYLILGDILSEENPKEIFGKISQPEIMEGLVKKFYGKRLSTIKSRIMRAGFYSTLSILLANSLSLVLLEIPLAKLITGEFMPITIAVDILGPTLLMILLTMTIKKPSKNNLELVTMETIKIIYERKKIDSYEIKIPKKRGVIIRSIIALIYFLGAIISFGFIYWIFKLAKFPPTSVVINIIFVSLITFAGLAIRKKGEELNVEEKKTKLSGFLFDILSLPVASVGRWFSNKWKKYNAIAAFFNALIDMPFLVFVEFLEQWRFFLKEKKEEIH
ncbi:MAG: hypothetical protein FJZ07_02425 [Candidatus Nealsonbacteria bacterium]|nr:hypothetical protein [Candidatus Nealsonbacteria bacterium]